jgi:hypothetical protein
LETEEKSNPVSAEEWTREQSTLAYMCDVLMSIRSVLIASNSKSGRAPPVHPYPRPTTAIDKARKQAVQDRHAERVAMLLGQSTEQE